jgi:hypothetical protein
MFDTYNNTLCVHASWLCSDFISKPNYKWLKSQYKLRVLRRGCRNTPALVEYISIPAHIRQLIINKVGDPLKFHQANAFENKLKQDEAARRYFANHTTHNGKGLPSKRIEEYHANAVILNALLQEFKAYEAKRKALQAKDTLFWKRMVELITDLPEHAYPHALPLHPRRLKSKLQEYEQGGFETLIHAGYCNSNSEKINPEAQMFVVSQWANHINKIANMAQLLVVYNEQALRTGWKCLKEEKTLYAFLNKPNIKPLWYGHRYGEGKAKEKYMYQHSTAMPTMRDSLWYGDGTKLNYYYQDENGKMATCQVYEVMDAYSEVLLGYHISPTENYEAQYYAFKMAATFAGHRPYQLGMDNQGGHKKLISVNFLEKLARLAIKAQPYNGKSKTIESAFNRFQSQYMKAGLDAWNFTGQNITAKKLESKANMEYVMANKNTLPTLDEVKVTYASKREQWNNAMHPSTNKSRIATYLESVNPESAKLELWDLVDLFWIQRADTTKVNAYGIIFTEAKVKYNYMVKDANGYPDLVWLQNNIDRSFIIKFDPMDKSTIFLYEDSVMGPRFVAEASTKTIVQRNKQEQTTEDLSFITTMTQRIKDQRVAMRDGTDLILEQHNLLPEQHGMNSPNIRGIESARKQGKSKVKVAYQDYDKEVSNMVAIGIDDEPEIVPTNLLEQFRR